MMVEILFFKFREVTLLGFYSEVKVFSLFHHAEILNCFARDATGVLVSAAFLGLKLNTPGTSCYIEQGIFTCVFNGFHFNGGTGHSVCP